MFLLGSLITVTSNSSKSETKVMGFYYTGCYLLGAVVHPVSSQLMCPGVHGDAGQPNGEL